MKRLALCVAVVVLVVLGGASQSRATITFHDDFESEPVPPIPPNYIGNYRGFANWGVIGSGVDLVGPGPRAHSTSR